MKLSNLTKGDLKGHNIVIVTPYKKSANWDGLDFITNNNRMQLLSFYIQNNDIKELHQTNTKKLNT